MVRLKYADASQVAALSTRDLLGTYEAQVVRALREIDQTLKLVVYWRERDRGQGTLASLRDQGLLPPDLLFTVSIADPQGRIADSTHTAPNQAIADQDYFRGQRDNGVLFVGKPGQGSADSAVLNFSRRLSAPDGSFDGVVIVTVAANYFVSGYDAAKSGESGVLGLVGSDGVSRVMRSGETVRTGDSVGYSSLIAAPDAPEAIIADSSWDGVRRWLSARELYGFPLAVIAGLSVDEQAAGARRETRPYWWRAGIGSVFVVMLTALLGTMAARLAESRVRENETKLAHAQRVEYLAYHDGLTGLPNRSMFSKLLSQSISEAGRYGRKLAVAFLDLDRFKQINDTLGHEAGDELLKDVANRLRTCVRESDTVARLGGDEFVVVLPQMDDPSGAAIVAEKILSVIAEPFVLIGNEFRVTVSIGISVYPQDGLDEQTLTKNADIAMYQAKAQGKNKFQFYSSALNANSLERLTLESSLRRALEHEEFRLCYQAKRDIRSGRITGMEALLRWQHPDLGLVAPMQFIPIAEETGLIVPIGRWVLKTACRQNVGWLRGGADRLVVAVNLTARQFFDERLLDDVSAALESSGMDPRLLEFEISERLLIRDADATLRILSGLKRLGVRIAIDDFGTGYSSLSTLQRFPLDAVKIDRSFVNSLSSNCGQNAFADAVIAMGRNLSLTVVAQGVETGEQADCLRELKCDEFQGFYLNRPLPPLEFENLLLPVSA